MPLGAKHCSAARSPSQLEGSSYLRQFEGSLCSFHVAYLFLVQFLLNIFIGNILSDLRTRITVPWSDYDFHYVKKLPRILINIDRVIPNSLTVRYPVRILRLCDSGTRSETIFPVKIFKRNWLRMRFAAWNGLKLQVSVQQLCGACNETVWQSQDLCNISRCLVAVSEPQCDIPQPLRNIAKPQCDVAGLLHDFLSHNHENCTALGAVRLFHRTHACRTARWPTFFWGNLTTE